MSRVIFKSTLYRSNPHIVRCFVIDDSRKISELIHTVMIIYGMNVFEGARIVKNTSGIGQSSTIADMFSIKNPNPDDEWKIIVPISQTSGRGYYFREIYENETEWIFNLELLITPKLVVEGEFSVDSVFTDKPKSPEGLEEPLLLTAMGMMIPSGMNGVKALNRFMDELYSRGYAYTSNGKEISTYDTAVDFDKIRTKLTRMVNGEQTEVKVNYKCTLPTNRILETSTLDDLKYSIQMTRIRVGYNKRKALLISDLAHYYNRAEFWKMLLNEFDYEQYMDFKNKMLGNSDDYYSDTSYCELLERYCLCAFFHGAFYIPEKLVDYYEEFLNQSGDSELLLEKKARMVAMVALRLYGIFCKEVYDRLCKIMFPNEPELMKLWKQWNKSIDCDWASFRGELVASISAAIRFEKEPNLDQYMIADNYYYPTSDYAKEIYQNGLKFSDKVIHRLRSVIDDMVSKSYYYYNLTLDLVDRIYEIYHLGEGFDRVKEEFYDTYYERASEHQFQKLKAEIEKVRDEIRTVELMGYTGAEAAKIGGRR